MKLCVAMVPILFLCLAVMMQVGLVRAATDNITLFGAAESGWGFASNSITSPGPTITVQQGDTVNLTLISSDGITHQFSVSYSNSSTPSSGEPLSSYFSGSTSYQFIANSSVGTYRYYCTVHPTVMWGYFTVVQAGTIPEIQTMMLLLPLALLGTVAVAYKRAKKHA